ncbi:MAG: ester cyclase [Acidobacteriaceae bacterium]
MSDANKRLVHRWFDEVWNQGSTSAIEDLFHSDGKAHGFPEPGAILTGPSEFKQVHALFHGAFSQIHVNIEEILSEGDHVAARWTCTVSHTGEALGFPATGRRVAFTGASFIHFKDGKIAHAWNDMDLTRVILDLQTPATAKPS